MMLLLGVRRVSEQNGHEEKEVSCRAERREGEMMVHISRNSNRGCLSKLAQHSEKTDDNTSNAETSRGRR